MHTTYSCMARNMAYTTGRTNSITRTMTTGGNTYKEPRIRHEVQLWDVQTGKMAWIGGTFTKGNTYAGFDNLVSSLADEVRRTLEKEGFIKLPPPRAQ